MTPIGVKLSGGDQQLASQLEQWRAFTGTEPAYLLAFGSDQAWSSPVGEFIWANGLLRYLKAGLPVVASIPLCPKGGGIEEVISGQRDGEFRRAATVLAGKIKRLRVGWEANGKGMGWGRVLAMDSQYKAAYERVTDIFLGVSQDWEFIWSVLADPQDGSGFPARLPTRNVHGIELDLYWFPEWTSPDPEIAFSIYRDGAVGLESVRRLAEDMGLPWGIGEWGVRADGGRFVELMAQYFKNHPEIAYHTYWDDLAGFQSRISDGKSGTTGEAYRAAFGPAPVDPRDERIVELEGEVAALTNELAGCRERLIEAEGLAMRATERANDAEDKIVHLKAIWDDLNRSLG